MEIGSISIFLATALDPFFLERVLGGTIALVGGDLSRLDVLKLRLIGEDLRLQLFGIDRNHFPARADRVPDKNSLENVRPVSTKRLDAPWNSGSVMQGT